MTDSAPDVPDWLDVSRETIERLQDFAALLRRWTVTVNLVSKSTIPDLWSRHILDSAQLFSHSTATPIWADLGSGGGLPGIVVAILLKESRPDSTVVLIEADARKAAFLAQCIQQFELKAQVRVSRIESLLPVGAGIVSARALAPLDTLLGYAARHISANGKALFLKGATWESEVAAARKGWAFDCVAHPSHTDPNAAVLEISHLAQR